MMKIFDGKSLFKTLSVIGLIMLLCMVTDGAAIVIAIPFSIIAWIRKKSESLIFWILMLMTSVIINPYFIPKGPIYGYAQRGALLLRKSDKVLYHPIGIHAARDMARLSGLVAGDLRCLFRAPTIDFEKKPGGRVWLRNRGDNIRYCLDKMRTWGCFVAPATTVLIPAQEADEAQVRALRVLWVGRLLRLKSVDALFKAVYAAQTRYPITLTIVGQGPEQAHLAKLDRCLAKKYGVASPITVHAAVPVAEVRAFMRSHEVYVLPSNAYEGWGAVVSEALEEGMEVLGTYEAGSSATVLPQENLFHAGDWRSLRDKLVRYAETRQWRCQGIGMWSAKQVAAKLSISGQEKRRIV